MEEGAIYIYVYIYAYVGGEGVVALVKESRFEFDSAG